MLVKFLLGTVGLLLFLFIFWKRLKEDYSSEIIFRIATSIIVGFVVGLSASKIFFPAWFFWGAFVGSLVGMFLMIAKFKLRFYETFEALILAGLPVVSIMFFKNSISFSSLNSFLAFVASLILIFLAFWFDLNYKSFNWYKSGKIGFAGLVTGIIFFSVRTVIAIVGLAMVSFVGKIDALVSGLVALILIGLLINLGIKEE